MPIPQLILIRDSELVEHVNMYLIRHLAYRYRIAVRRTGVFGA